MSVKPKNLRIKILIFTGLLALGMQKPSEIIRDDFKKYFDQYRVEGSFVLFDARAKKHIYYNKEQANQAFVPASTYKICNSLIGLETGVIPDENFVIPWDGVSRKNPNWNKDCSLKTAFQHSAVWYYQELARRVGADRMKYWLDKSKYGNADTTGGIDRFWLTGKLRITPIQQIAFLQALHQHKLPFSKRNMEIVKKIMIEEQNEQYILRSKTGWGSDGSKDLGWYVGYLQKGKSNYYFACCIQTEDQNNPDFAAARMEIARSILKNLELIP